MAIMMQRPAFSLWLRLAELPAGAAAAPCGICSAVKHQSCQQGVDTGQPSRINDCSMAAWQGHGIRQCACGALTWRQRAAGVVARAGSSGTNRPRSEANPPQPMGHVHLKVFGALAVRFPAGTQRTVLRAISARLAYRAREAAAGRLRIAFRLQIEVP